MKVVHFWRQRIYFRFLFRLTVPNSSFLLIAEVAYLFGGHRFELGRLLESDAVAATVCFATTYRDSKYSPEESKTRFQDNTTANPLGNPRNGAFEVTLRQPGSERRLLWSKLDTGEPSSAEAADALAELIIRELGS
uniref:Uncharacterized protein n=1 Tax=Tetraselmis sp. GSL018 TaxID=582737 RepID=A0A061S2E1_9CHLO